MSAQPSKRDQRIVELYTAGQTMEQLASEHGVSRQRVQQIISRVGGPGAEAARAVRREQRDREVSEQAERFLTVHRAAIEHLAAAHAPRVDVEALCALLLPEVPGEIIKTALAAADIVFDVNVQEFVFPAVVVKAAVWYVLAVDQGLVADVAIGLKQLDVTEASQIASALESQGLEPTVRAEVLNLVAAAQRTVAEAPDITISKQRYDEVRRAILTDFGLVSAQGAVPWPPTSQTVIKRLGGGYWAEALRGLGLTPDVRGRPRGLLRFDEADYEQALLDFFAEAAATGLEPTFDQYGAWVDREDRAGRRRPAPASLRLRYRSWNNAKRTVGLSRLRTADAGASSPSAALRPTAAVVALHRADEDRSRFRERAVVGERSGSGPARGAVRQGKCGALRA